MKLEERDRKTVHFQSAQMVKHSVNLRTEDSAQMVDVSLSEVDKYRLDNWNDNFAPRSERFESCRL